MNKRKTQEEFIEQCKSAHPNFKYDNTIYENANKAVIVTCPVHGDIKVWPNTFIHSIMGCKYCSNRNTFIPTLTRQLKQKFPTYEFPCIENIKKTKDYIKVICPKHGLYSTKVSTLLKGCECKKCCDEKKRQGLYSHRLSVEKVKIKIKNKYPNLDTSKIINYKNFAEKSITIGCPIHGFTKTSLVNILNHGCPKCHREMVIKNRREIKEKELISIIKKYHSDYNCDDLKYIDSRLKVIVNCPKHGPFKASPFNLRKGRGCPICQSSKGEIRIQNYLVSNNIYFQQQKRFENFKQYPYDFYLPNHNLLIEFNGEQHYIEIPHFYNDGRESNTFEHRLKTDIKKKDYAEKNGYKLLVIPYTEFNNIESILEKNILSSQK